MRIYRKVRRKALLAMLALTKIVSSTERSIPGKWHNVVDSVKVSSQAIHAQLSILDDEVTEEYYELEKNLSRRVGKGKLYSKEDLDMARKRIEQVEFQNLNRGI
ncbi:MAG: hypothetical protein ABEK16_00215 [Candidatus Nanohalobium sp.]